MIDHVTANVGDVDAREAVLLAGARAARLLGAGGVPRRGRLRHRRGHPRLLDQLEPRSAARRTSRFTAPDRAAVDAFHEAAIAAGGEGQRRTGHPRALPPELLRGLRPRRGRQQHRGGDAPARVKTGRLFLIAGVAAASVAAVGVAVLVFGRGDSPQTVSSHRGGKLRVEFGDSYPSRGLPRSRLCRRRRDQQRPEPHERRSRRVQAQRRHRRVATRPRSRGVAADADRRRTHVLVPLAKGHPLLDRRKP